MFTGPIGLWKLSLAALRFAPGYRSIWEARFKLLPGKHKKHRDLLINQKAIRVKKSMFRKHQGSE